MAISATRFLTTLEFRAPTRRTTADTSVFSQRSWLESRVVDICCSAYVVTGFELSSSVPMVFLHQRVLLPGRITSLEIAATHPQSSICPAISWLFRWALRIT